MSQTFTSESPVASFDGGRRWRRVVALVTAAVLTLLVLLAGAAPAASAAVTAGSLVGWGDQRHLDFPTSLASTGATAISVSGDHGLALTPGGKVVTWGEGRFGLGDIPSSLADETATAIAAGSYHSLVLTSDGKITAWGFNNRYLDFGQARVPASLDDKTVTAIAAGEAHSLALTSDGKVTAWGFNDDRQIDVPASLAGKTVTAIAAGAYSSVALTSDGKITIWGANWEGQADVPASLDGKTVTAVSVSPDHTLALTSDGEVTAWGYDGFGQTDVPASLDGKTVTAIATGANHNLALTSDGKITAWGRDDYGQTDVPASLDGRTVTAIAAGTWSSFALTQGVSPVVSVSPVSAKLEVGTEISFTAAATGSPTPTVQWQRADRGEAFVDVPGATSTTHRSTMVAEDDGAGFRAVFTNAYGSVTTAVATVTLNSPPSAKDLESTAGFESATPITLSGSDPDGDALTYAVVSQPGHGTLTGAAPAVTYTPDDGYSGDDSFTYRVDDGYDSSATATVSISVTKKPNTAPTATNLEVTAGYESATPVILSGTDPDGDTLTYAVVARPEHGTLSGDAPALTYTPDDGYSGADSFTYRASDGTDSSATATVLITVTRKPNTPPTATNLKVTTSFESATAVILSGTDPDGDTLTYAVIAQPEHGMLSGNPPALMYSPDDGYSGADSFTYRVNDGTASSATATIRLTVTPQPCTPATPRRDFTVHADQRHADGPVRTPKVRTKKSGELLLAFVAADGSTTRAQSVTAVTGGGLTWTLVQRENTTRGTSEVWQAYATKKVRSTRVAVDLADGGHSVTVTVAGFSRAGSAVVSSALASGTGSAPAVSLTPQATGSSVWAVGRAVGSRYHPEPVAGQKVVHHTTFTSPPTGYWTQRVRATSEAGADVRVGDKAEAGRWGYAAVEIPGACR